MLRPFLIIAAAASCAACSSRAGQSDAAADTAAATAPQGGPVYAYERIPVDTTHAPGTIIDSTFPMPEMLRRFRQGLTEPRGLVGGQPSMDALVTAFVAALSRRDRTALGTLSISRAEFAWIYFPALPEAQAENGIPPTLRWDGIVRNSEKGANRALDRIGGKALTLTTLDCPGAQVRTLGAARLHDGCTVTLTANGVPAFSGRLFGPVLEYAGRFKFTSYANDM